MKPDHMNSGVVTLWADALFVKRNLLVEASKRPIEAGEQDQERLMLPIGGIA